MHHSGDPAGIIGGRDLGGNAPSNQSWRSRTGIIICTFSEPYAKFSQQNECWEMRMVSYHSKEAGNSLIAPSPRVCNVRDRKLCQTAACERNAKHRAARLDDPTDSSKEITNSSRTVLLWEEIRTENTDERIGHVNPNEDGHGCKAAEEHPR
jgi:hypothetical protein